MKLAVTNLFDWSTLRGEGATVFSVVVIAEHELEQSVPAVPMFMLGMSLMFGEVGWKATEQAVRLQKLSHPPQLGTDKFCKGLDLDCHRELEERPSRSPLLSSTPILSTDYGTLSLEIQGSFHRPHITIVEEAAGGFSNSLNAKISYTPLLENADFLIVSAADLNLY